MAFNSNGQISYLVLDSLSNGSKYGLEIIEFISQKTGGTYIMKKPTLYSCLTRMEKKGLVSSSYWGESEFGGKRHYYTITNEGKTYLETLKSEFENVVFDNTPKVSNQDETKVEEAPVEEQVQHENENKPVFLQQDNIFNMVKTEDKPEQVVEEEQTNDLAENQMDFFSYQAENNTPQQNEEKENVEELSTDDAEKMQYYQSILESTTTPEKTTDSASTEEKTDQDDGKLLDKDEQLTLTPFQEEQNKRIYDTSAELKKYRKKKSFSENQIEMSVVYENDEDREIQRNRIEQLKQSMLNAREHGYSAVQDEAKKETSNENLNYKQETVKESDLDNDVKDDAIFITNPRMEEGQIPIQKKISPPNIEVNIYDDDLPAPKRDSNLEPTYKDMMAKLFERKKEKATNTEINNSQTNYENIDSFTDYETLKKYYAGHGIDFKEYHKTSVKRIHNTNLLKFISSSILLLLSGVGCGVLFAIINAVGLIRPSTNFMYYTLPILFFVYLAYCFVMFKFFPSKKASLSYNSIINWAVFVMASIIVLVINIICGMQYETMKEFLTTLIIPIYGLLIAFPINYYIKKFLYKKFAK